MKKHDVNILTNKIISLQDENGCWNVLNDDDKYYPELNYYIPNYKSTLWTLILLADIETDPNIKKIKKPLSIITDHFYDIENKIFSIGKSHFPIPCLNGNMIYLLCYFKAEKWELINGIIDFFFKYQRFDDGDFKTPSKYPYYRNKSCYGSHTCYWGVLKLFKGLSFIPKNKRSKNCNKLIKDCIDFILLHKVCYSSHDDGKFIQKVIRDLTFPNMYNADFLEVLWLLKREKVISEKLNEALDLLKSKMESNGTWKIERRIKDLIVPIGRANHGNDFITKRANEVISHYS